MAADNDFNRLMDCLRRGDEDAASEVFHRFARRLIALARSQLDSWIRTRVEPEDVVQSVFRSFFTRFEAGQFQFGNWDNLWTVLTLITIRKCANRLAFWQAAKRDLQREVSLPPHGDLLTEALARDPTRLRHRRHQRAGWTHGAHGSADLGARTADADALAIGRGRIV
jgi:hypothetical protein